MQLPIETSCRAPEYVRVQGYDVTIVIPAYRAEDTICRAVDSALSQDGVKARVIVVIDGVFDDTANKLNGYQESQVKVLINAVNKGASAARNDGLSITESEFVMFLDSDDFVEGSILSGLVAAMQETSADIGFAPVQIFLERRGLRKDKFIPNFTSSHDIFRRWHLEGLFVPPCGVLWRTSFLLSIGGWDPELSRNDDGELVMRAILRGARFVQTSEGSGIYVKHSAESLNNRTDNMQSMLAANEKLLAIRSPAIDDAYQRRICSGHYFNIAWHCYLAGRDDLGDEALARSRALGYSGGRGPLLHRAAFATLGLKRTCKILAALNHFGGRKSRG